jgi:flagellar FliJ protein
MSAFRFRLENLLRLRTAERDQRRSDLSKALAAEAVLREHRRALEAEFAENEAFLRKLAEPGAGNVDAMMHGHRYEALLKARSARLEAQQAQVAAEVERRRQLLVEADRQVRILEKLRERKRFDHQRREDKREVQRLDEAGVLAHLRRREGQT